MPIPPLPPGTTLRLDQGRHRYEIIEAIGEPGGFGIVYRAKDLWFAGSSLEQTVAIKELAPSDYASRDAQGRLEPFPGKNFELMEFVSHFSREAQILQRLRDEHVVAVYDSWRENGTAYYAMADLTGAVPLRRDPARPMEWSAVERVGEDLLAGLDVIHRALVYHLDLKPANVLVHKGKPILIDFGTSKLRSRIESLRTKVIARTSGYAAPELHASAGDPSDLGPWTDLYAWAMLVYGLVCDHPGGPAPMEAPTRSSKGDADPYSKAEESLLAKGAPAPWAKAVAGCLALDLAGRQRWAESVPALKARMRAAAIPQVASSPDWAAPPDASEGTEEIVVCGAGTGKYTSLTEAIAAASSGAHIHVRAGDHSLDRIEIRSKKVWIFGVKGSSGVVRLHARDSGPTFEVHPTGTLGLVDLSLVAPPKRDVVAIQTWGQLALIGCHVVGSGKGDGLKILGGEARITGCVLDGFAYGANIIDSGSLVTHASIVRCRRTLISAGRFHATHTTLDGDVAIQSGLATLVDCTVPRHSNLQMNVGAEDRARASVRAEGCAIGRPINVCARASFDMVGGSFDASEVRYWDEATGKIQQVTFKRRTVIRVGPRASATVEGCSFPEGEQPFQVEPGGHLEARNNTY